MKKIGIVIAVLSVIGLVVGIVFIVDGLKHASLTYTIGITDDCSIYYNNDNAFLGKCSYKEDKIELPSEYKGVKIESLGGYYGSGAPVVFHVDTRRVLPNLVSSTSYEIGPQDPEKEYEESNLSLDIVLPKYLKTVKVAEAYSDYYLETENNNYHVNVYYNFEIDSDNKTFYSEN